MSSCLWRPTACVSTLSIKVKSTQNASFILIRPFTKDLRSAPKRRNSCLACFTYIVLVNNLLFPANNCSLGDGLIKLGPPACRSGFLLLFLSFLLISFFSLSDNPSVSIALLWILRLMTIQNLSSKNESSTSKIARWPTMIYCLCITWRCYGIFSNQPLVEKGSQTRRLRGLDEVSLILCFIFGLCIRGESGGATSIVVWPLKLTLVSSIKFTESVASTAWLLLFYSSLVGASYILTVWFTFPKSRKNQFLLPFLKRESIFFIIAKSECISSKAFWSVSGFVNSLIIMFFRVLQCLLF